MRKEAKHMRPNVLTIIKLGVSILSVGVTIATSIIAKKEMDLTIAEKVAEAIAHAKGES